MKNSIAITTDKGTSEEKTIGIENDGYLIFSLIGERIKMQGNMDMRALAPILTRIALERLSK